jgi:hypothetical protein
MRWRIRFGPLALVPSLPLSNIGGIVTHEQHCVTDLEMSAIVVGHLLEDLGAGWSLKENGIELLLGRLRKESNTTMRE